MLARRNNDKHLDSRFISKISNTEARLFYEGRSSYLRWAKDSVWEQRNSSLECILFCCESPVFSLNGHFINCILNFYYQLIILQFSELFSLDWWRVMGKLGVNGIRNIIYNALTFYVTSHGMGLWPQKTCDPLLCQARDQQIGLCKLFHLPHFLNCKIDKYTNSFFKF